MSAMAKRQKDKGDAFVAEAEQKLTKSKGSWFTSSKERKFEEAAELYEQAANAYKVGGFNQEAGGAYKRAAEIHRDDLTNLNEASKDMAQAGSYILLIFLFEGPIFLFNFVFSLLNFRTVFLMDPFRKMLYQEQPHRCCQCFS